VIAIFVVAGPERVQSKLKAARAAMRLHLNIGPEERPEPSISSAADFV